jgi:hypothetical protein
MKVALVAVLFVACAFAAVRPKISEVFEAHALVNVLVDNKTKSEGEVFWAANQPKGLEVEIIKFHGKPEMDQYILARYDQEALYQIHGNANHECQKHTLTGSMPLVWGWLNNATYKGRHNTHGHPLDLWSLAVGHAVMTVGVTAADPNTPVLLERAGAQLTYTAVFHNWHTREPHTTIFAVPHSCQQKDNETMFHAENLKCVDGSTMISRAAVWVNNHVPYNQGATYQGYREDCSGYVSMAWGLSKPGYTTYTLPQVSHPISKGQLKPGDIILNKSEHVVLFGGWADGSQTHYVAYEETRPREGTVKRVTPYPYWYQTSSFLPYRYNNIC